MSEVCTRLGHNVRISIYTSRCMNICWVSSPAQALEVSRPTMFDREDKSAQALEIPRPMFYPR